MSRDGKISTVIKSLLLLLLCLITTGVGADEKKSRRIMVGIKLFPAVIAADYQLAEKIDGQGYLSLLILHEDKPMLAQDLAERLIHIEKIRNLPVKVEVFTFDDFINGKTPASIAVFLAQSPNSKINKILDRANSSSVLLFSPFKGDVEKGIHSGFMVSDRILPHVNLKTIQQAQIKLKAFFLRVSRHYD